MSRLNESLWGALVKSLRLRSALNLLLLGAPLASLHAQAETATTRIPVLATVQRSCSISGASDVSPATAPSLFVRCGRSATRIHAAANPAERPFPYLLSLAPPPKPPPNASPDAAGSGDLLLATLSF